MWLLVHLLIQLVTKVRVVMGNESEQVAWTGESSPMIPLEVPISDRL